MQSMSLGHFKEILECVRKIHTCTDPAVFPSHVLSILTRVIPCQFATFDVIDPVARGLRSSTSSSPVNRDLHPAFERYMHQHPTIGLLYPPQGSARTGKGGNCARKRRRQEGLAVTISDVLTDGQFRRLALYNEFYRLLHTDYQMAVPLQADRNTLIGITFNRDRRDFSQEERYALNTLGPNIVQAYRTIDSITRLKRRVEALETEMTQREIPLAPDRGGLSLREGEVLHYVAMGKSNAEVAAILRIAPTTVKTHLERIYGKLGVYNRTAASQLVFETLRGK